MCRKSIEEYTTEVNDKKKKNAKKARIFQDEEDEKGRKDKE